jgi:hypothetical protein
MRHNLHAGALGGARDAQRFGDAAAAQVGLDDTHGAGAEKWRHLNMRAVTSPDGQRSANAGGERRVMRRVLGREWRLSNSHDISRPDRIYRGNRGGHQWRQIPKTVGWPTENHQGNLPSTQVLLIRNVLVRGNQNIKAGLFGSLQEAPVLQARKISETGGFALVAGEQKA